MIKGDRLELLISTYQLRWGMSELDYRFCT